MNGAASGHYFENFIVIELLKNYSCSQNKINMTYYRDSNVKEIDIFVERNKLIHPLKIKKSHDAYSGYSNLMIHQTI
jgi:predicted AAA+ superfamily ATPase